MRRSTSLVLALAVTGSLVGTACSDSSDPADAAADPTTTAAAGGATSTTSAPSTTVAPVDWDFSAITPIVEDFIEEKGLNGAGLVIVHRDHGVIDEQYFGEFDADRISLIASSSKMITAGVLAHLQDQELLDMDAPVAEVAEWGEANPDITPAQLVSNSSGLVGLIDMANSTPYLCQYSPNGTLQECAETIFTTPDDDEHVVPPDTEFRYGGGQWQVAGAVAEVASGKSWAELIEEIYVEPCDLDVLAYNNHFLQGLAGGAAAFSYPLDFDGDPSKLKATDNPNMEGGVYVTTGDYAKLLLMHLRDGRCGDTQVLSPEALDMLHSDRIGEAYGGGASAGRLAGSETGYGMGWWVDRESGRITDPGAYGSVPWLDLEDGYGAYLVVESTSETGMALAAQLFDVVEEAVAAGVAG